MKKKNKGIVIGLLVLAFLGTLAYLALRKTHDTDTLGTDSNFAVKDTAAVTKVFMSSKAGVNHTMTRLPDGQGWVLEGEYKLRPDKVDLILSTLHDLEVKRPVSKAERAQVIKTLAGTGIKIEVYKGDGRPKVMYIGGEAADYNGSFAYIPDAESPFIVGLPYMNGIVNNRFDIQESNWRASEIFNSPAHAIEKLTVAYAGQPGESFSITQKGRDFSVEPLSEFDTLKVMSYLDKFRKINAQNYIPEENKAAYLDTLSRYGPLVEITLKVANSEKPKTLMLYQPVDGYVDILFGKMKDEDELMVVQHFVIDKLLVTSAAFAK